MTSIVFTKSTATAKTHDAKPVQYKPISTIHYPVWPCTRMELANASQVINHYTLNLLYVQHLQNPTTLGASTTKHPSSAVATRSVTRSPSETLPLDKYRKIKTRGLHLSSYRYDDAQHPTVLVQSTSSSDNACRRPCGKTPRCPPCTTIIRPFKKNVAKLWPLQTSETRRL
jgi:hypothetical protein